MQQRMSSQWNCQTQLLRPIPPAPSIPLDPLHLSLDPLTLPERKCLWCSGPGHSNSLRPGFLLPSCVYLVACWVLNFGFFYSPHTHLCGFSSLIHPLAPEFRLGNHYPDQTVLILDTKLGCQHIRLPLLEMGGGHSNLQMGHSHQLQRYKPVSMEEHYGKRLTSTGQKNHQIRPKKS